MDHVKFAILQSRTGERKELARAFHAVFPRVALLGLFIWTTPAFAQPEEALPSSSELKKLSLEELMDIEVTSVSRHAEKLSGAASAIQVIGEEDIRRSGATS